MRSTSALDGWDARTPLDLPVSALMVTPVVVTPDASVHRVATAMTGADASAAIVADGDRAIGIVTDADLRSRHLAVDGDDRPGDDRPVSEVTTSLVRTLGPDQTVGEALALMASRDIHHIPVVDDGHPVGILDAAAVLAVVAGDPVQVLARANSAADLDALGAARRELPVAVRRLVGTGTGGLAVAHLLSLFTEQAIARIVAWAVGDLGPAPAPWAMVALGSLARREQTLVTDQDHALVVADGAVDHPWFAELGRRVSDDLATVGFPHCPGGVMIANPQWRDDVSGWRRRWQAFLAEPAPDNILASNIVLDARVVAGSPDLIGPFLTVAQRAVAGNTGSFLLFLANSAREHTPPLGLANRWKVARRGEHAGRFDVKAGAVLPIVSLARVHAIAAGSPAMGTVERLRAAASGGTLSEDSADILVNGYDLVLSIRLLEQTDRSAAGRSLDNWIAPGELSAWQRAGLREVCRTIKVAQDAISLSYLGAYV